jgi:preprotein translocase subunit SecA
MVIGILKKLFGTRNERVLKRLEKNVAAINSLEFKVRSLSNEELKNKTHEFRERLKEGETIAGLLPEAFAVVREVSIRTLGLRHFDVQLIGGMVLHEGKIAEMRTGEGKTLAATLASYLNSLTGKAVHIVTVNDYLAKRDASWMGPIYDFLGLSVGLIIANQSIEDKRQSYARDIVYGTNNEFGFDYLRDNMAFSFEDKVQRGLYFAIIDEVDSILIDEARTPLIISGPSEDISDLYTKVNRLFPYLKRQEKVEKFDGPSLKPEEIGDYTLDEKVRQVYLTESGHQHVEDLCVKLGLIEVNDSLYDAKNIKIMHHINAALRAHTLFRRDIDYIVRDGEIIIVDEHTGRTMDGRRWSDGLHQAIEAKEEVSIRNENQTLASITFQNYFRLYDKISGMTGTADTEAYEFQQIYDLEVVVIPPHMPMIRQDLPDQIYLTVEKKFDSVLRDIKERSSVGQPVLVGTASIETSEQLAKLLVKEKIPHQVLNAKHHEREAKIIAQAGKPGAVTIATNMAGRGTDIILGGSLDAELNSFKNLTLHEISDIKNAWQKSHDQVIAAGGLHVIGSERHESRRIDNQLRGRSGRQGDPGSSRFYLSLEDSLLRVFASDRVAVFMKKLGIRENEVIEHNLVTRAVENAQRKVEGYNFDLRKHLLEFDDVSNEQRKVLYKQRDELMLSRDISANIAIVRNDVVNTIIDVFVPPKSLEEQWDISGLERELHHDFGVNLPLSEWLAKDNVLNEENLRSKILNELIQIYQQKEDLIGPDVLRNIERSIMLQTLDAHWKDHLADMDYLRDSIHLRGYAQQNPKQEYKLESFNMFVRMLEDIKRVAICTLYTIKIRTHDDALKIEQVKKLSTNEERQRIHLVHKTSTTTSASETITENKIENKIPYVRNLPKVGRNDPCCCGSGRKYKQCHGKLT